MKRRFLFAVAFASIASGIAVIVGTSANGSDYVGSGKCTTTAVDPCTLCTLYYDPSAPAPKCYARKSSGTSLQTHKVCQASATDTEVCWLSGNTFFAGCGTTVTQWTCTVAGSMCLPGIPVQGGGPGCQCPITGGTLVSGDGVNFRDICSDSP